MHHLPANCLPSRVYRTNTKIKMTHATTTPHPVAHLASLLMPPPSAAAAVMLPLGDVMFKTVLFSPAATPADTEATNSRCRQTGSISMLGRQTKIYISPRSASPLALLVLRHAAEFVVARQLPKKSRLAVVAARVLSNVQVRCRRKVAAFCSMWQRATSSLGRGQHHVLGCFRGFRLFIAVSSF